MHRVQIVKVGLLIITSGGYLRGTVSPSWSFQYPTVVGEPTSEEWSQAQKGDSAFPSLTHVAGVRVGC